MLEIRLVSGKGDFVRRKTSNEDEEVCLCNYNADVSEGCPSQVPPSLFKEVMENNGKYSEETRERCIKENGKLPDLRCTYCYAKRHNGKNIAPKFLGDKTREDFERIKPQFVRLNKNTEFGHPIYRDKLMQFLDLCNEYKSRAIFPTKMLEFDKIIAEKLMENGGLLSYSQGNRLMEPGVNAQGFTNKWRTKQAERYYDMGVNTALTMALDITDSIENDEKRGFYVEEVLNSRVEVKRIIPMKLTSAKVALLVTGIERKDLINPLRGIGHIKGWEKYPEKIQERIMSVPYFIRRNNDMVANYVHSDFKKFEENIRICGQVGEYEYCDKCNLYPDRIKFHVSELVEIEYAQRDTLQNSIKKRNRNRKGMKKSNNKNKVKEKAFKINFSFDD